MHTVRFLGLRTVISRRRFGACKQGLGSNARIHFSLATRLLMDVGVHGWGPSACPPISMPISWRGAAYSLHLNCLFIPSIHSTNKKQSTQILGLNILDEVTKIVQELGSFAVQSAVYLAKCKG